MTTDRPRRISPPAPRRYADHRYSTGGVIATSFDARYSHPPRGGIDTLAPSRGEPSRSYGSHPIVKKTYVDPGYPGPSKSRAQPPIPSVAHPIGPEDRRRPPSIYAQQSPPSRNRPLVSNTIKERPRVIETKPRYAHDDMERSTIYPAISGQRNNHQRHYSMASTDLNRLAVGDRDRRERAPYRNAGPSKPRSYAESSQLVRSKHEDDFSYTGPREQFDRDYPVPPQPRRENLNRRERPASTLDFDEWKPLAQSKRDPGPPPVTTRQFDKLERGEPHRANPRVETSSDNERDMDITRRRHPMRAPISLHQDRDSVKYERRAEVDDRRDPRPRKDRLDEDGVYGSDHEYRERQSGPSQPERKHWRQPDGSPDRPAVVPALAAAGIGGAAAVGIASGLSRDRRDDDDRDDRHDMARDRRDRRRRDRDSPERSPLEENDPRSGPTRERRYDGQDDHNTIEVRKEIPVLEHGDSDSLGEDSSRRHRQRRQHRDKDDSRPETDSGSGSDIRDARKGGRSDSRREKDVEEPLLDEDGRLLNDRRPRRTRDHSQSDLERIPERPGDEDDGRPRRVLVVEPPKDKDQEVKPKGILKPARQVPFPEDPNPTREGVAPLKDAGKQGIPANARWTKINRMLVNPAALEAAHERYEEREGYVIVLRVLTREEIEKFAAKTAEIREAREAEWQARHERRKHKENKRRDDDDYESEDDEDPRPAIEPPPSAPPTGERGLAEEEHESRPAPDPLDLAGYNHMV